MIKMKWIITILILIVVFIAGCSVLCEPNWIAIDDVIAINESVAKMSCKTNCHKETGGTSSKIDWKANYPALNFSTYYCYCDVNDCNPNP
jgi:hypothetical protein